MVAPIKQALAVVLLSIFSMTLNAGQECVVLSNGSKMTLAHYKDGTLQIKTALLKESTLRNPVWPAYSKFMGGIIFEAGDWNRSGIGIYITNSGDAFQSSELLMPGRYSALSPDGEKIAYFNKHNNLTIKDLRLGADMVISEPYDKLSLWNRPLWISNNELIYTTQDKKVSVFNRSEHSHSQLISEKLFPVASSNGSALFTDNNAKTLFEYKTGKLNIVINNRFLSTGPGLVMLKDGFLYSRQTWSEALRLSEAKSIFYFERNSGSEKELISKFSLFGGSLLPCIS